MASRNTLKEAQELKAEFKKSFGGVEIRIVENTETRQMGRIVAEEMGLDIDGQDDLFVTVKVTRYDVLEVRHCGCGQEILTQAIGEIGLNECPTCRERRENSQNAERTASIARQSADIKEWASWN